MVAAMEQLCSSGSNGGSSGGGGSSNRGSGRAGRPQQWQQQQQRPRSPDKHRLHGQLQRVQQRMGRLEVRMHQAAALTEGCCGGCSSRHKAAAAAAGCCAACGTAASSTVGCSSGEAQLLAGKRAHLVKSMQRELGLLLEELEHLRCSLAAAFA